MAKVFITGGAGFIGYFLSKELFGKGHAVVIYDSYVNYISPLESHYPFYLSMRLRDLEGKATLIRGDIRYRGYLVKALKDTKPDVVVHLAAIPIASVSNTFSEDTTQINLNGTVTVLESIRAVDHVKRFVYASSSFVYGNFHYDPVDENHPCLPIDLYGATKLSGEIFTKVFGERFGQEYVIVRPSSVYGPTDCNMRVSQIYVENAFQNKPLVLEDGGVGKIDFTYVEDTAHGIALACFCPEAKNQTFNITRGEGRSPKEYAEILQRMIPGVRTVVREAKVVRPKRGALDISKARRILGYEPKYSLEEGLKAYVDFVGSTGLVIEEEISHGRK